MADTLLITFGCSWTYGVGAAWQPGQTQDQFNQHAWDGETCDRLSWRGIVCDRMGWSNLNFSQGGSSNQKQFRRAQEFFSTRRWHDVKQQFKHIVVLWGITSTARNEMYSLSRGYLWNFFYTQVSDFSRFLVSRSYDHGHEVEVLHRDMRHWNDFFQTQGVNNYWFDTFNTHDYDNHIPGMCDERFPNRKKYEGVAGPDWPDYADFCNSISTVDPGVLTEFFDIFSYLNLDLGMPQNLIGATDSPRDLMSMLCEKNGKSVDSDRYHVSDWVSDRNADCDRVEFLVGKNLLNPFTHHPSQSAHQMIADHLLDKMDLGPVHHNG